MKLAIISDLHSNREALEAVFEHIQAQGVERIYCLGDVVGYGPEPEFCVDLVRGHAELTLMGKDHLKVRLLESWKIFITAHFIIR